MPWKARTRGDFLRRIAFDYLRYGYERYAVRMIPEDKCIEQIDSKMIAIYNVSSCRTTRSRRRCKGQAIVQYLRCGHVFVLLATQGQHQAFERIQSFNIRTTPLHLYHYSIGLVAEIPEIRVAWREWQKVKKRVGAVTLADSKRLEGLFASLPYYRFPGVVRQKRALLNTVNRRRKAAGLKMIEMVEGIERFKWDKLRNKGF
jgi:hypothetical protein